MGRAPSSVSPFQDSSGYESWRESRRRARELRGREMVSPIVTPGHPSFILPYQENM